MMKKFLLAAAAVAVLAGCAGEKAAEPQAPESAMRETLVTKTAVVEDVDLETRQLLLRTDGDMMLSLVAGPEVRNLAQLSPGDTVRFDYYEGVAVQMADPSDTGEVVGETIAGRAPEGGIPGAAAATLVSMVVEFESYDPATNIATFTTPDGVLRSVSVKPEMRDFAVSRQPGDRIEVTMAEAVAVTVEPMTP